MSHPASIGAPATRFTARQLSGLPDPVTRYLRFALSEGQPLIMQARVSQNGHFAMRRGWWRPFTATQDFSTSPPGFTWTASIRMAPMLRVHVRDSYVDGDGEMLARLGRVLTLVHERGSIELASSALVRFLSEGPWTPTVLLPSRSLTWEWVDEQSARATLRDGVVQASVIFRFGPDGAIVGVSSHRYRSVGRRQLLTPQEGRFGGYERVSGMMVPSTGEVAWLLPDGAFPYWRAAVSRLVYTFAP